MKQHLIWLLGMALWAIPACNGATGTQADTEEEGTSDGDADADADADADSDADTDSDTDADTDTDSDFDSITDSNSDTLTGTDHTASPTDNTAEYNADTHTETHTESSTATNTVVADTGDTSSADTGSDSNVDSDTTAFTETDTALDTVSETNSDTGQLPDTETIAIRPLQLGYMTHYWDCCKNECSWGGNNPALCMESCDMNNNSFGGNVMEQSACAGGNAYQCWAMHPRDLSDSVSVGFVSLPGGFCGQCYQLDFTGAGQQNSDDAGSKTLAGKQMIVQVIGMSGDEPSNFKLLVPGGGAGESGACATQWGTNQLGDPDGGIFSQCRNESPDSLDAQVACAEEKCNFIFSDKQELLTGCLWWTRWGTLASMPELEYRQVACPEVLSSISGVSGP